MVKNQKLKQSIMMLHMKLHSKINLILLLILTNYMVSQTTTDNHRKYWWYKTRLNNDFVKVGTAAGESFPFNQRGSTSSGFTSPDVRSNMEIGDGTSTLGLYIAQLATEYALLVKNSQNTDKVKHELFCALNAFDRVDIKAEEILLPGSNMPLNGFFVRDDIPKDFLFNNYQHFNYYNTWDGNPNHVLPWSLPPYGTDPEPNTAESGDKGFHSNCQIGMFKTGSSWSDWVDKGQTNGLFKESQDQAYDLLLGLAFVNKFVGSSVTDGGSIFSYTNETSLRAQARNQASRIINYMKDQKNINGYNTCYTGVSSTGWRIVDPISCTNVSAGDNATAYGYALAESGGAITIDNFTEPSENFLQLNHSLVPTGTGSSTNSFHNLYSKTIGFGLWNTAASVPIVYPYNPSVGMDTRVFNTNLSAICDCVYGTILDQWVDGAILELQGDPVTSIFGIFLSWWWHLVSITTHTLMPGYYKNITTTAITTNAYPMGSPLDHGPIAHALLHDKPSYEPNPQYTFLSLLDVAPCDGIYNFSTSNQSTYEWSSDNRCDHPNRRGVAAGSSNGAPSGEYNGIDYIQEL